MKIKSYKVKSIAEFYYRAYDDMMNANEVGPRGLKTKEIIAPEILLTNPKNRLAYNKDRRFGLKFAITEALLLFSSTNKVKYVSHYNKTLKNFSDDGQTLYGSYGLRIADNIEKVVEKLKRDESSRQAVLTILQNNDPFVETKDVPCTLSLQFLIRDNKLNMIVNMRSNDIMWGIPYDMFMFSVLQEAIANTLEIGLGWYIHRPASLHLYEKHYSLFEKVASDFANVEVKSFEQIDIYDMKMYANTFLKQVDCDEEITVVDYIYKDIKNSKGCKDVF